MKYYEITSENSSDHWGFVNSEGKNVLDIGCGIWYTEDLNETSPLFFGKTANLVIGIDSNENCINTYNSHYINDSKYVFNCANINSASQVKNLISQYDITLLKSDIEGGEVVLLDLTKEDLNNITDIAIEFHTLELKQAFLHKIPNEWGFTIHTVANFRATPDNLGVIYGVKNYG